MDFFLLIAAIYFHQIQKLLFIFLFMTLKKFIFKILFLSLKSKNDKWINR
jgi:hypothetical protein